MTAGAKKKKGLGRGLGALISSSPVRVHQGGDSQGGAGPMLGTVDQKLSSEHGSSIPTPSILKGADNIVHLPSSYGADVAGTSDAIVSFVPYDRVVPNPDQPRKHFDEGEVEELVSSIKSHGVLQPILVRPVSNEDKTRLHISADFMIVAGERRYRAAGRAGLAQVPVIIRHISEIESLEIALIENVQRSNLTPLEEARGYQELMQRFNLSQSEVADKVGKDRASISNMIRLLKLPDGVQKLIDTGKLSVGHAKAILTVKEPKLQNILADKVIREGLSVRELERIVARKVSLKNQRAMGSAAGSGKVAEPSKYPELTEQLRLALGTRVFVQENGKGGSNARGGKIIIEYFSAEELERIADQICQ